MTRFETILSNMDRTQKTAAKKGFADWSNKGDTAENPYAKFAESKKHAAWQVGFECAIRSAV